MAVIAVILAAILAGSLSQAGVLGAKPTEKPFHIPSATMIPTLMPGDFVMVRMLHDDAEKKSLTAGVIVVFKNPVEGWEQVGRIIATSGQAVIMRSGMVYVDDTPIPQEVIGEYEIQLKRTVTASLLEESLGAMSYEVLDVQPDSGPLDNVGPYRVPEGHYFVLGDNRDMSMDSRVLSKVGYVPAENIIGAASYIYKSESRLESVGKRLDR